MSNLYGSGTANYDGIDLFNRVIKSRWTRDLGTDVDFVLFDIEYDRNSNIPWVEDQVLGGLDRKYTNDNLNRLVEAEEGTRSGASITSATRLQTWKHSGAAQLDQVGNWTRVKLNLNVDVDSDYADQNEYDDTRTHNQANELTARDTDSNASNNYTLTYDAAGNLTDDAENYKYEYDAFHRLRKVKNTSTQALIAEYLYNGLGQRIGWHADTDTDGDVDGSDLWYYLAYDPQWRNVATFRSSDASPKENFVYHAAAGSKLDDVILRDKDANSGWTSAADGTLEQRYYYCQNWRGDVSAVIASSARQQEQARYSAYGVPIGIPAGDVDGNFLVNAADATQVQTWINGSQYNVRGDVDMDGDVDSTDHTIVQGLSGNRLGWGSLSLASIGNRKGYAGYEADATIAVLDHVRHRVLHTTLGKWLQRDPVGYRDSMNLYMYVKDNPIRFADVKGLTLHVFAFEGLWGYDDPATPGTDGVSDPFVGDIWKALIEHFLPHIKVHYHSQADVNSAVSDALQIAEQTYTSGKGADCTTLHHSIATMGFSNGGAAAIKFAKKLQDHNIKVDHGFTADPIPQGFELVPPLLFMPQLFLKKPQCVPTWRNFYQKTDWLIDGHPIGGGTNTQLFSLGAHGHTEIVGAPQVTSALLDDFGGLYSGRTDYMCYQP